MTITDISLAQDRKDNYRYQYAVYKHKLMTPEGLSYSRSFIVIKNQYAHTVAGIFQSRVKMTWLLYFLSW